MVRYAGAVTHPTEAKKISNGFYKLQTVIDREDREVKIILFNR